MKDVVFDLIDKFNDKGFDIYIMNKYPFILKHNLTYMYDHLPLCDIQLVTNAKLSDLEKEFKKYTLNNDFFKSFNTILMDKKEIPIQIFYCGEFINKSTEEKIKIKTINDIKKHMPLLVNNIALNNKKLVDYIDEKNSAFNDINNKTLKSNGNIKEKFLEDPLWILKIIELSYDIGYSLDVNLIKNLKSNMKLLKNISKEEILDLFFNILRISKAGNAIKLLKELGFTKLKWDNIKIFEFLDLIEDDTLELFNNLKFKLRNDELLILLLSKQNEEQIKNILNLLEYKGNANKILWCINNFDLYFENDYKQTIYNSRFEYNINRINILQQCIRSLYLIYKSLSLDNNKCQFILDALCSRPYYKEQIMYTDEQLLQLSGKENGSWLNDVKEFMIQRILEYKKHPTPEEYLEIAKESIESALINEMLKEE